MGPSATASAALAEDVAAAAMLPPPPMPALLNRTFTCGRHAATASRNPRTCASFETSAMWLRIFPELPSAAQMAIVSARFSAMTSHVATSHP